MKRILSIFLIILTLFTFVACSGDKVEPVITPESTTFAPTESVTPTPTIIPTEEITPAPTVVPTQTPVPTATIGPIDLTKFITLYVSGSVVNVREGSSTSAKK